MKEDQKYHTSTKALVINLDASVERYASTCNQLSKSPVQIVRIPAVEGALLGSTDIEKSYCPRSNKRAYRRGLSNGEIACYLSHRKAWSYVIEEGLSHALVLEDDIFLKCDISEVLAFAQNIGNWDILKLFNDGDEYPQAVKNLSPTLDVVSYNRVPNCACAYLVSFRGAKKLLSRKKVFRPVDIDMQFFTELDLTIIGMRPYPFTVDYTLTSDIDRESGGRRKSWTWFHRNLIYRFQLMRHRKKYISSSLKY